MVRGLSQFLRKPTAAATVPVTVTGEQFWFTKHGGFPQNQITQCCHHCSCDSQGWVVLVYQVWWVFQEPENQLLLPLFLWQSRMSGSGLPSMVSGLSQYQKTNRCCNCSWVSGPGLPSMVGFLRTRKPTAAAICSCDSHGWVVLIYQAMWVQSKGFLLHHQTLLLTPLVKWQAVT